MDRNSGGLANGILAGIAAQLSPNYRIVPDRRKGQSAFGSSLPQGERRDPTQFHHDCANKISSL
jgi:hypothetical protein